MNTERLLKLADHLEQVIALEPKTFDMASWADDCGTTACALGWACRMPEFADQGLRQAGDDGYEPFCVLPNGEWAIGYEAAEVFFDLTEAESHLLFDPWAYERCGTKTSASDVAARIRELVDLHATQTGE